MAFSATKANTKQIIIDNKALRWWASPITSNVPNSKRSDDPLQLQLMFFALVRAAEQVVRAAGGSFSALSDVGQGKGFDVGQGVGFDFDVEAFDFDFVLRFD